MRALTLHQPWASLVKERAKTIETRSWRTHHRGRLAIHAAQVALRPGWLSTQPLEAHRLYPYSLMKPDTRRFPSGYAGSHWPDPDKHPLGAVVATCELVDVVPIIDRDACEWHHEHPDGVAPCAHAAVDNQVVVHAPWRGYHTTVLDEQCYGDYTPGRWAWLLDDITPCDPPLSASGKQGLWEWDEAPTPAGVF